MLVLSYEIYDIVFYKLLDIYGAQSFALHSPRASLPLVTCSSPHRTRKEGEILHLPRHFLLTLGAGFTTHGSMLKGEIYHFLGFSSHGSNSQAIFLSH